jgi:Domain of unknown function (DUF932)
MQRGVPLQDFASRIKAAVPLKKDIVASTRRARMVNTGADTIALEIEGDGAYGILEIAHDQMAEWAKIPAKYYDRMRKEAPGLLCDNVNRWFQDGGRRMFRTTDGWLRAFLSDRYRRIEHEEIANAALEVLLQTPGLSLQALEITERRMYIFATTSRVQGEVKVGDVVQAGVKISNSEVGFGRAKVEPQVFRLWCLNGATMADTALRATHVGRQIGEGEDLNAIFADDTRKLDDETLLLKMRDVVTWALSEAGLNASIAKLQALAGAAITGNPVQAVEVLSAKIGVTGGEKNDILSSLIKGADLSAWGLMNAVAEQAHKSLSFDRAVEFEDLGGKLAAMPRQEWEPILSAA